MRPEVGKATVGVGPGPCHFDSLIVSITTSYSESNTFFFFSSL